MVERRAGDRILLGFLAFFSFNAIVLNPLALAGFPEASGPLATAGGWYAGSDPLYADPPPWMRFSLWWGTVLSGAYLLVAVYAFWKQREWIRNWTLLYAAAALFETVQYFVLEFQSEEPETNLLVVTMFNLPWLFVPGWLTVRAWQSPMFGARAPASADAIPATEKSGDGGR